MTKTPEMELTYGDRDVRVYDNVFSEKLAGSLWRFVQATDYAPLHGQSWQKVWRLHEGSPVRSLMVHSHNVMPTKDPGREVGWRLYPTYLDIDIVIEAVLRHAPQWTPIVGKEGRDWSVVTAAAFLYPQQAGLGWHSEGTDCTGAYVYYAAPQWEAGWGGELLVAKRKKAPANKRKRTQRLVEETLTPSPLDYSRESEFLMQVGMGHYIAPRPNRLVLIGGGVPHRINPVLPAAGDHVRASIAGRFMSSEYWQPPPVVRV